MNVYEVVTQEIIKQLEEGVVGWHVPWRQTGGLPLSLSTGRPYRGINPFLLQVTAMAKGYSSRYWGTYDHIKDLGGQVKKGEKGTLVTFWKLLDKTDSDGNPIKVPMLKYYKCFNADQQEGARIPKQDSSVEPLDFNPIDAAEAIVASYKNGPEVIRGGDRACYSPGQDKILMPEVTSFESAEAAYSTLFHEMTHSTGHKSRLARPNLLEFHHFGDANYSKEELTAEMGAAMLSAVAGIEQRTVGQSAAYIASWLKVLKGDAKLVVTAAAQAQKAADFVRGIAW